MRGFNIIGDARFVNGTGPFGGAITLEISRDLLAPIVAYIDSSKDEERDLWGIEVSWSKEPGTIIGWRMPEDGEDDLLARDDGLICCFQMFNCREIDDMPSMEAH